MFLLARATHPRKLYVIMESFVSDSPLLCNSTLYLCPGIVTNDSACSYIVPVSTPALLKEKYVLPPMISVTR